MIYIGVFVAAFTGGCLGIICGLTVGAHAMVKALKDAFPDDTKA